MTAGSAQIDRIVAEGASRLLDRAAESYSLNVENLFTRIRGAVEKYLLKADPGASEQEIFGFIDELQADDLCLIVACEQSNQDAWNDLVARFSATVRSAARSSSSNEDAAEDISQSIWAELYGLRTREDGKPASKLAYYSGRGSLAGWLRAVVAQLAVDQHRKQSRLVQTEQDEDFDRFSAQERVHATASVHLEESITNKFAGVELQKALEKSFEELPDEDRLLVKLYYFDGLKLREVGSVLGVHEATASRRLTKIHSELRKRVEGILTDQGWERAEIDRAFTDVGIDLEADLETMVTTEAGVKDKAGK